MAFTEIYGWILIGLSLSLGATVSFWIWNFAKSQTQKERFLLIRKPTMIILYCVCGSIPALLVTTPVQVYITIYYAVNFRFSWLLVFCHQFLFAAMLTVIAARCWLLYYDHSYGMSVVDQNWRGVIDPHDTDFWLRHRKTWGDVGFIVCFMVIVTSAALMLMSCASIWVFQTGNMDILPFVSMFLIALPACLFISILIFTGRLKKLYDEFSIRKELQYLSLCTWLIVILYILEIIDIDKEMGIGLVIETGEVIFSFLTSWIQCKWVFHAMKAKQIESFMQRHHQNERRASSVSPRSASPPNQVQISMADVLRDKEGFGLFMRQCQNEMCVEGLLYIVEVAQYKSKIQQYEKNKAEIKAARLRKNAPESSLTATDEKSAQTVSTSRTDISASSTHDPDAQVLPPLSQVVTGKLKKDDLRFEQFRGNILSREWLPISDQLNDPRSRAKSVDLDQEFVHFKPNTLLEPIQFANKKEKRMSLVVAPDEKGLNDLSPSPPHGATAAVDTAGSPRTPRDVLDAKTTQQTNQFLYDYAKYLFLKYIDVDSDFAVNVSHHIHKQLLLFFSCDPTHKHFKKLYRVFDPSVAETWNLLANDTFRRFKNTSQYHYLLKKVHHL